VPQEFFLNAEFVTLIDRMELSRALKYVWGLVGEANKVIDDNKPWELVKTDRDKFEEVMNDLTARLAEIAEDLIPFMPETAKSILTSLETKKTKILFERIKIHS
jgi:methionyl-tRNA synthetase